MSPYAYVKISAVHITAQTLIFILFFSKNLAGSWTVVQLPQHEHAYSQNKHIL